jgi:hypothetical protein
MSYHSIIGMTAAALSIVVPTEAAAQSAVNRAMHFAQQQSVGSTGYKLERASLALAVQPDDVAQPVSTDGPPRDADQVTKSAAYKWEAGFLALSAVDAVETISCLDANRCTEGNPIWGRHPSTGKIIATKLGLGLVQFGIFKLIVDHDPHAGLRVAQVSAVVQGGFVLLNLRHTF